MPPLLLMNLSLLMPPLLPMNLLLPMPLLLLMNLSLLRNQNLLKQREKLLETPPQQTSVTSAISPPASKEKRAALALPLCLFLPFFFLQSLPAFCSMSCLIFNCPCLLFCSPETSYQTVRH